jgi:hypothetical protein
LGCFAVSLFPVLGFLDMYYLAISRVSDHFAYLPLIAIVALVAAGGKEIRRPRAEGRKKAEDRNPNYPRFS